MKELVVFGNAELADVAYFYLKNDSAYKVAAFTVDQQYLKENSISGLPVAPFEEIESSYPPAQYDMFIPLSYKKVNKIRAEKYSQAKQKGYEMINYISSKAVVWPGLVIGDNCFILENNVIQPFVEIGSNVILWSGNHIGHHSKIGDHCFLASQIVVSGGVTIEPYCFIGVNATVRDHVLIRRESVIGAGALIMEDTLEKSVYIGLASERKRITSDKLRRI